MSYYNSLGTIIDSSEVVFDKQLGKGSFSVVYLGHIGPTDVAIKVPNVEQDFLEEAKLMCKIQHPNLLRYFCTVEFRDSIGIVCELCDINLKKEYKKNRKEKKLSTQSYMSNALKWLGQAAKGLCWLHNVCRMVHHDVKPPNILVLPNGNAVVSDFGFTRSAIKRHSNPGGSPYYYAPEIWKHEPVNSPVDVYAFGITMFEVLLGDCPYDLTFPDDMTEQQVIETFSYYVIKGGRPKFSRFGTRFIPPNLVELMKDCWKELPEKLKKDDRKELPEELRKDCWKVFFEELVKDCRKELPGERPTMDIVCKHLQDIFIESFLFDSYSDALRNCYEVVEVKTPPEPNILVPKFNIVNLLEKPIPMKAESPACIFWKQNFREIITDRVYIHQAVAAYPDGSTIFNSLADHGMIYLDNLVALECWYGDWLNAANLHDVSEFMVENKWFFGPPVRGDVINDHPWPINAEHAAAIVTYYLTHDKESFTKQPTYLVRCSLTNPYKSPYTLTLCDERGNVTHHRIYRNNENLLSCPGCTPEGEATIYENNLLELLRSLYDSGQMIINPIPSYPPVPVY